MRFSETIKTNAPELVVSRRHEDWVSLHDHPVYSTKARGFAAGVLNKQDRVRKGTISASSLGNCERQQQFTYLGMPKIPTDTQGAARMLNGAFMHLRWQMEGLTEGWLNHAEVPVNRNPYQLSGTMDGLLYEGSILELKSINSAGYGRVVTFGPLVPHLFQMATYMLCTGRDKGVFIYECKDNQEYTEIVVGHDDLPMVQAEDKARGLWKANEGRKLKEPLEKCIDREGFLYRSCPYRHRCLNTHSWEQASGT